MKTYYVFIGGGILLMILMYFWWQKNAQKARSNSTFALSTRTKYTRYDVFQYRGMFLRLGLAFSIGLCYLLMSYTIYDKKGASIIFEQPEEEVLEVIPPRTMHQQPELPKIIEVIEPDQEIEEPQEDFVDMTIDIDDVVEVKMTEPVDDTTKKIVVPPPLPKKKESEVDEIFAIVEEMPRFPGCDASKLSKVELKKCSEKKMFAYFAKNIKYPVIAKENDIQGRVVVQFVVEKDGSITDVVVVRDIGAGCGKEAIRVIEKMNDMPQKWSPGKQRNQPVRVKFTLPVMFKLQ